MPETCPAEAASCLVAKLSHYIELTTAERRFLATIEQAERKFRRRDVILELDGAATEIMAVKSGWIVSHASNPDGGEYVAELYLPGDVFGISQVGFERSPLTYTAATEVVACPFPKGALRSIFKDHPRLVALFFALATLEQVAMIDRMRAIGRMSARDNLAVFLLQLDARVGIAGGVGDAGFVLPLSQELIGNVLGLSMVSVNRAFRLLEEEGRIRRRGRTVEIVERERLAAEVDFNDRHYTIDKSWFPAPDGG